jgi:hypothetical protein
MWLAGLKGGSGRVMCGMCGVLCPPLDRGENTLIPVLHAVRATSSGRIQKGQIGETVGTGRCRPIRTSRLVQKSQYGGIGTQVGSASEDVRPQRQSNQGLRVDYLRPKKVRMLEESTERDMCRDTIINADVDLRRKESARQF